MNNQDLLRLAGFRTVGTEKAGDGLIVDVELIVPEIHPCRCGDTRCKKHGKRRIALLGARPATLNDERRRELKKLLKDYPTLDMAVQYKEAFFEMYDCKTRTEAEKHYETWVELLPKEMEKPFAVILRVMKERRWKPLILNYFEHPYTNAYIEALNGLIDQINRTGRGYNLDTLRAKAMLRYGKINRMYPRWDTTIVAEHGSDYLDTMFPLHQGHGIDLATFERDLAADSF